MNDKQEKKIIQKLINEIDKIMFEKSSVNDYYDDNEMIYLQLSRENQLEVLKLSKELLEYYKKGLVSEKNRKCVEKYLNLNNDNTKFENYEKNHPHFEFLTQEQIDDIHSRGKITPREKYNEWEMMGYCPASGGSSVRCNKYGNCRDCLVAWAEDEKEWTPIKFEAINILDRIENVSYQKVKK